MQTSEALMEILAAPGPEQKVVAWQLQREKETLSAAPQYVLLTLG